MTGTIGSKNVLEDDMDSFFLPGLYSTIFTLKTSSKPFGHGIPEFSLTGKDVTKTFK